MGFIPQTKGRTRSPVLEGGNINTLCLCPACDKHTALSAAKDSPSNPMLSIARLLIMLDEGIFPAFCCMDKSFLYCTRFKSHIL